MMLLRPDKAAASVDSLHPQAWFVFVLLAVGVFALSLSPYTFIPDSVYSRSVLRQEERDNRNKPICGNLRNGDGSILNKACQIVNSETNKLTFQGAQSSPQNELFGRKGQQFKVPSFDALPIYRAECWLPAQYEVHTELYVHQACKQAMNNAMRGQGLVTPVASIFFEYKMVRGPSDESEQDKKTEKFEKLVAGVIGSDVYQNRDDVLHQCRDMITRSTAVHLFCFALMLTIPSFLWRIVSSTSCTLNIDKTLDLLRVSQSLGFASRQIMYENIAKETLKVVGRRTTTDCSAGLFLACKFLCCLISAGEMIYTFLWVMPELRSLSANLTKLSYIAKAAYLKDFLSAFCHYKAYNSYLDLKEGTVQCAFHQVTTNANSDSSAQLATAENSIAIHAVIFHVVFAFLVLHTLINILGTVKSTKMLVCCGPKDESATHSKAANLLLCFIDSQLGCVARREMVDAFKESETTESGEAASKL